MRRAFVAAVAILFLASVAPAQTPLSLGLQAGVNFANSSTDPDLSLSSKTGMMVGGFVEVPLSPVIYITGEVFYIQKGAELSLLGFDSKFKLDYLEIPILLKAKFDAQGFTPFVFAGPNFGINVSSEIEASYGGFGGSADIKDWVESLDMAIDFGAGGEIPVAPTTSLVVSIRYSLGLTDAFKEPADPDFSDFSNMTWKNTGVQLVVGVRFAL